MYYHELTELTDYDPETGVLRWKERPLEHFATPAAGKVWNARFAGKRTGSFSSGQWKVTYNRVCHQVVRVVYLKLYGHLPECVGYLDGNPSNMKPDNLIAESRIETMGRMRDLRYPDHGEK